MLEFVGVPTGEELPSPLGSETPLSAEWTPGEGIAFTATLQGGLDGNYWWGKADDEYDVDSDRWRTTTVGSPAVVEPNGQLRPSDEAFAGGINRVLATIVVGDGYARTNLYRPPEAQESDTHALRVRRTPGGGVSDMSYLEVLDDGAVVTVDAWVRDYGPGSTDLTGNRLRATVANEYPQWVLEHYLQGANDDRIVGPKTREMADRIMSEPGTTPYDWAVEVQRVLRAMEYDTDIRGRCEGIDGFPECLLTIETGFCQQYATTMVMLMRAMGVPARFVTGYLQGELADSGQWVVQQAALHNWAEVYFPGEGWVRFDPTPNLEGLGQVPTELDDGEELVDLTPPPDEETPPPPEELETALPTFEPPVAGPDDPGSGGGWGGTGIFISLAGLAGVLVALVSVLLLFRLRRLPEGDDSLAYRGIVSLATRLGHGPHPAQTEYEYANTLSDAIPTVRDDLYVVTDAQFQTTYGEQDLDDEERGTLRGAYARIRTALLRLSIRWRR